jgi:hypothetical protein
MVEEALIDVQNPALRQHWAVPAFTKAHGNRQGRRFLAPRDVPIRLKLLWKKQDSVRYLAKKTF